MTIQIDSFDTLPEDRNIGFQKRACSENGFYNYFAGLRSVADDCKVQGRIDQWILPRGEYIFCNIEAENFDALVSNDLFLLKQYCFVLIHIVSN